MQLYDNVVVERIGDTRTDDGTTPYDKRTCV